jgi:hypothetical protein
VNCGATSFHEISARLVVGNPKTVKLWLLGRTILHDRNLLIAVALVAAKRKFVNFFCTYRSS